MQLGAIGTGWAIWIGAGIGLLGMAFLCFVLVRFGLVALVALFLTTGLLGSSPHTFDSSRPYFGIGLLMVLIVVGLGLYGFRTSLAGRPLTRDAILES